MYRLTGVWVSHNNEIHVYMRAIISRKHDLFNILLKPVDVMKCLCQKWINDGSGIDEIYTGGSVSGRSRSTPISARSGNDGIDIGGSGGSGSGVSCKGMIGSCLTDPDVSGKANVVFAELVALAEIL